MYDVEFLKSKITAHESEVFRLQAAEKDARLVEAELWRRAVLEDDERAEDDARDAGRRLSSIQRMRHDEESALRQAQRQADDAYATIVLAALAQAGRAMSTAALAATTGLARRDVERAIGSGIKHRTIVRMAREYAAAQAAEMPATIN